MADKRTKPASDKPKKKNITILVTDELRTRIDKLRETHYPTIPINLFTGQLVVIGLEKEEARFLEEELTLKARLERAGKESSKRADALLQAQGEGEKDKGRRANISKKAE